MKKSIEYGGVILAAVLLAYVYYIFIVTNSFAPAGLNGIATMIQYKTGFSISYMSLLINIPLSILAYFLVQKDFAIKTMVFSLVYSFAFLALQSSDLSFIQYNAQGHDTIYPVILSGVLAGVVYGVCFRNNASTGGTDIVSRYVNKIRPETNFFVVTFTLNAIVAIASIFVYSEGNLNYKPMALCILYCFISTFVGNLLLKTTKTAYKFTVNGSFESLHLGTVMHVCYVLDMVLDTVGTEVILNLSHLCCFFNGPENEQLRSHSNLVSFSWFVPEADYKSMTWVKFHSQNSYFLLGPHLGKPKFKNN